MSEALELEIEAAWVELTRMRAGRQRTLYLTPRRHVEWRPKKLESPNCIEIGTYSNGATLADLRDDVFWTHEQRRKAA
ncbi:hypothetical protein [Lysobacter sp. GCM10012299]|uniref:hypothetical protein n=1 Tax=Lysobacter sp. GCM10012299 TaxID=3317333 RepID=UPI00360A3AC7